MLSLRLPSSSWVADLAPVELKDILSCLEEELGLCFIAALLFFDSLSFVSAFPHFPN